MNEEPETFRFEMLNAVSDGIDDENYGDYPGCDLMTVAEFLETVEWGGFIPDDGSAIIRGGTKDKEYWDWLTPIPSDATHIEWYNK